MDDYYQVKHRFQAPAPARKSDISHWFTCGEDGRAYGHVITKISRMDRLPNLVRHGAPLARTLRPLEAPLLGHFSYGILLWLNLYIRLKR